MTEYRKLKAFMGEKSSIAGQNENGEDVILEAGESSIKMTTFQFNTWIRINIYHEDGTVEELYEKATEDSLA